MEAQGGVRLSGDAWNAIRAEAVRAFPEEGCGFLVGPPGGSRIDEALARANVHPGPRATRYRIDGFEYVRLETTLEGTPRALVGVFHSHPHHPAVPSETDREVAWPGLVYLVQSLHAPEPAGLGPLRAWRVRSMGGPFEPVELVVDKGPARGDLP